VIERVGHRSVDNGAALVGVLLLVAAELGTWSTDLDARIRTDRALVVRRAALLAALCVGALGVDALLLGASSLTAASGALLAAVGTAAAVSAVAVVLRLVAHAARGV
jgi:hypothetical protein